MGKSSMLKILAGHYKLDGGQLYTQPGLKIAELAQDLPDCDQITVYEYVAQGLNEIGVLLKRYHELTSPDVTNHDTQWFNEVDAVQKKLEIQQGWQFGQIIDTIITSLDLNADQKIGTMSGGWQRRAALARALVSQPDLLLLDEPTNHLDLKAIEWLEGYLAEYPGALLCITHDRSLLRKLSTRIIELDRGYITSWNGDFDSFLKDREHRLEVEATHAKKFDKVLAKEEAWIRQGIKARRTRNEGRVRALEQLRIERGKRRELQGRPKFQVNHDNASGDLVVRAEHVNFALQDKVLVQDFSMRIYKGDKIALIGPNGVGKSTWLKLILGLIAPQTGTIKLGTNLQVAYFEQTREGIDLEESALDNVSNGRESISVNGKEKHIISYLGDFLFSPERARIPVRMLSGGERNRLYLAKLFSLPSNLLVLDEPTNDLDIESLELLEELLANYTGTILLVSHDRAFIDQVATSTLVFRGNGIINEYCGGFKDIPTISTAVNLKTKTKELAAAKTTNQSNAFTSKMRKELQELPAKLATAEQEQQRLHLEIAEPNFYSRDKDYQSRILALVTEIDRKVTALYQRWEELEQLQQANL